MYFSNIKKRVAQHTLAAFFCISVLAHIILIASSPKLKEMIKSSYPEQSFAGDHNETSIEFVLNEPDSNIEEKRVEEKPLDILEAIEEEELELEEEKKEQQMFVDNSHLQTDEDVEVEADKIGENASIARDMKANDTNVNNGESFSDGDAQFLELEQGPLVIAPEIKGAFVVEEEIQKPDEASEANQEMEKQPPEPEKEVVKATEKVTAEDVQAEMEKPQEVVDLSKKSEEYMTDNSEDVTNEEQADEENSSEEEDGKEENSREIEKQIATALESMSQSEPLRDIYSEFDRIVPEPNESIHKEEDNDIEKAENENVAKEVEQKKRKKENLAKMPEEEKKEILRKIYETYENDINENQMVPPQYRRKRKVAMSVNGKGVYNISASSKYKADMSNSSIEGEASFNIKKHEYAAYYKHIRDKISVYWMLYFGTDQSIKLETKDGEPIVVEFKIYPSGKIKNIKIADDGGNPFLASRTKMSVTNTEFDKFPDFIKEEFIDVRFNFYFF